VTILNQNLRQHFERVIALGTGVPLEERSIFALLDAWHRFQLIDGEDCPAAREAVEHLLSTELRPALRQWYRRSGESMNPAAIAFRDRLGKTAGENFG